MSDSRGKITADQNVCMGSGLCSHIAPSHFEVVDGTVQLVNDSIRPDDPTDADEVREAIESCPTRALSFRESE